MVLVAGQYEAGGLDRASGQSAASKLSWGGSEGENKMFIAMNRFRVKKGSEEAFEKVWLTRESFLDRMKGFEEFHLLKGATLEDHTLYATHTLWSTKDDFEAWTKSEEFRAAHARAGNVLEGVSGSARMIGPRWSRTGARGLCDARTDVSESVNFASEMMFRIVEYEGGASQQNFSL